MTHYSRALCLLGAVLATMGMVLPAEAQFRGGGGDGGRGGFGQRGPGSGGGRTRPGGGGRGLTRYLQMEDVQRELDLSEEQMARIRAASERAMQKMEKMRATAPNFYEMTEEQQMASRMERELRSKQADMELEGILEPFQVTRIRQIQIQQLGVAGALRSARVIAALELTETQLDALRQIGETVADAQVQFGEQNKQLSAKMRDMTDEQRAAAFEGMKLAAEEIRKNAEQQAMGVLNTEQREKLGALIGEKFELAPASFGRPDGGRGGQPSGMPSGFGPKKPAPQA